MAKDTFWAHRLLVAHYRRGTENEIEADVGLPDHCPYLEQYASGWRECDYSEFDESALENVERCLQAMARTATVHYFAIVRFYRSKDRHNYPRAALLNFIAYWPDDSVIGSIHQAQ